MKKILGNCLRVLLVLLLAAGLCVGCLTCLLEETVCSRSFFTEEIVTDELVDRISGYITDTIVRQEIRYQMDADVLRGLIHRDEIRELLCESAGYIYDSASTGEKLQLVQYPTDELEAAIHAARGADEFGDAKAIAKEIAKCIEQNADFISESAVKIPLREHFFFTSVYRHLSEIRTAAFALAGICALLLLVLPLGSFFRRLYAVCGGVFLSAAVPFTALHVLYAYGLFDRISALGAGRLRDGIVAVYEALMRQFLGFYDRVFPAAVILLVISAFALSFSAYRAEKKKTKEQN